MCGITGFFCFKKQQQQLLQNLLPQAVNKLKQRGPDDNGFFFDNSIGLGHARLSIIDTGKAAAQPMINESGDFVIVFNGEFYNYKEEKDILEKTGHSFSSTGDTEVLLKMYIEYGTDFIKRVSGCFSICIYDKNEQKLVLYRDRYGIKPLYIYKSDDFFVFASEMKALLQFNIPRNIDNVSLTNYLRFNYIPGEKSIFENIYKVSPGKCIIVKSNSINEFDYYKLPIPENKVNDDYETAQKKIINLLDDAVKERMIADVPLGAFLSGGIDSSLITALASRHTDKLHTFSVGFKDEPYFDETEYALEVAKMYKTEHTVFSLSNNDLFEGLQHTLDYIDEPFADSSAIAVNILSKHTRKNITVSLSGDGADELFGGYNKHLAHFKANSPGILGKILQSSPPFYKALPQSRNNKLTNKFRQINRFATGLKMKPEERFLNWCAFINEKTAAEVLIAPANSDEIFNYNNQFTNIFKNVSDINANLYADMNMVLVNDMLTKVDLMSMANSLEVRVPFLDHKLVDYVMQLPAKYKVDGLIKKKILQDAAKPLLPEKLYNRPKHGFEVPLLKWMRNELKDDITKKYLNDDYIQSQGIFDLSYTQKLKKKLFSVNPEDVHAQIYALIVFGNWHDKYIGIKPAIY